MLLTGNRVSMVEFPSEISLCECRIADDDGVDTPDDRGGFTTQVAFFWALVVVVLFLCHGTTRCRNNGARRSERGGGSSSASEDDASRAEIADRVERSKAALVETTKFGEGQTCCICLQDLDEDVVHPHDCVHCYHRLCIEEWIDQAQTKSVVERDRETRTQLTNRMLSCPMCSKPFVPTTTEEIEMAPLGENGNNSQPGAEENV